MIHAATAVVMTLLGRRLFGARTGAIAGLAFVTLPGVALGSLLVSTDTPTLFFFAVALYAQLRLTEARSAGWALALGAAVGAGFMAKYVMLLFPFCAVIAAVLVPRARIAWRDAVIAGLAGLAVAAPNLLWNAANDFATARHTGYNADWQGLQLNLAGLAEFLAGQFAIAGPVLFAAYLAGLAGAGGVRWRGWLAAMSLPVFGVVSFQALQSGANANWAAVGHLAAALLAAAVLAGRRRWLVASFAINGAVTVALPLASVFADSWRAPSGELMLARYVGQGAISRRAGDIARAEGLDVIVTDNRGFLADLFYTLRDSGLTIRAEPVAGFPPHHYALKHPLEPGTGEVLFLDKGDDPPDCAADAPAPVQVARWRPEDGYYTGEITAWRVDRACWTGG